MGGLTLFKDRKEAAERLLEIMPTIPMRQEEWLVLALSEGGVYFAEQIAKRIHGNADYLFTEAIGAPNNPDCIIAMVSETEEIVIDHRLVDAFEISIDYVYGEAKRKYEEKILKYLFKYRKGELISNIAHRNIILVDEGADTGFTLMAAIKTVITLGASNVAVALPVIPESLADSLSSLIDTAYYVHCIPNYVTTGAYYETLPKYDPLLTGGLNLTYCEVDYTRP